MLYLLRLTVKSHLSVSIDAFTTVILKSRMSAKRLFRFASNSLMTHSSSMSPRFRQEYNHILSLFFLFLFFVIISTRIYLKTLNDCKVSSEKTLNDCKVFSDVSLSALNNSCRCLVNKRIILYQRKVFISKLLTNWIAKRWFTGRRLSKYHLLVVVIQIIQHL